MEASGQNTWVILVKALASEIWSQRFYQGALEQAADTQAEATLRHLLEQEYRHERELSEVFRSYFGHNPPQDKIEPPKPVEVPVDSIKALEMAMNKELNAERYYREAAEKADYPAVATLCRRLAEEEAEHYRAAEREYRARTGQPWEDTELDTWVRDD